MGGDSHIKVDREEFKNYFINNDPSIKDISKQFKIDRSVGGKILKSLGLESNYYVSAEEEKNICEDYCSNRNMSCMQLSKKYNRDRDTISRILKKNNIDILPSGSAKAKKIYVYDANSNEFLMETYIPDFCDYLKENNIVENPKFNTISNHIKRKGKVLYKRYRVRDYKEGD